MTFKTTCPHCHIILMVKEALVGTMAACPQCKASFQIQPSDDMQIGVPESSKSDGWEDLHGASPMLDDFNFDLIPLLPVRKKLTKPSKGLTSEKKELREIEPITRSSKITSESKNSVERLWLVVGGGSLAALFFGGIVGYVWFSAGSGEPALIADSTSKSGVVSGSKADASLVVAVGTQPKAKPTASQLAIAADLKVVLSHMEETLGAGHEREFLLSFAPMEELRKLQQADASGGLLPEIPRDALRIVLKEISGQDPKLDATGLTAVLQARSDGANDPARLPGPGYDGDVLTAINAAVADLETGQIQQFIRNMFPPDALQAMFRNGADRSPAALVEKDSAIMVLMIADLKALQSSRPQIKGNVAEFSLPPRAYPQDQLNAIRPAGDRYTIPPRVIRFSRINDRWRFYDNGTLRQSGALEGNGTRLELERIGTSWRLARYP